jgi:uncharacterized protein (DUF1684 family)
MKSSFYAVFVILSSLLFSCSGKSENKENGYEEAVKKWRKERHEGFMAKESSPLEEGDLKTFVGLNYFSINESLSFKIKPEWLTDTVPIVLATSTGSDRELMPAAQLSFEVNGKKLSLWGYYFFNQSGQKMVLNESVLFIPFSDETSGFSTYGSGRYLDIEIEGKPDSITLDFNYAYNPYCAYSNRYSCPFPPKENHLEIEILAGEKSFH